MPDSYSIDTLLEQMVAHNASDLHITAGSPPVLRLRGQLHRLDQLPRLGADETRQLLYLILCCEQQRNLEVNRKIDLSY
jgi:twitching motility protein PilT